MLFTLDATFMQGGIIELEVIRTCCMSLIVGVYLLRVLHLNFCHHRFIHLFQLVKFE